MKLQRKNWSIRTAGLQTTGKTNVPKIRTGCKKHKAAINVILKLKEVNNNAG